MSRDAMRSASDSAESCAITTEKEHERSIEFWSRAAYRRALMNA